MRRHVHTMSFKKHNVSRVLIPRLATRQAAKKMVLASSMRDRQKFLLMWVLDQEEGYVITVAQIKKELSWGEKRWVTVRDQLKSLRMLSHFKEGLPDKTSRWTLSFDLTPIFNQTWKKEGITRACNPLAGQGSRVRPPTGRGYEPNKHTPPEGGRLSA